MCKICILVLAFRTSQMDGFDTYSNPEDFDVNQYKNDLLLRHVVSAHRNGHTCHCGGKRNIEECSLDRMLSVQPQSADSTENCSICIDEYGEDSSKLTELQCGHVFHRDCISQWLRNNGSCPNCRKNQQPEYDGCIICRAFSVNPTGKGTEATLDCCGLRTHILCLRRVYSTCPVIRCPGCQATAPEIRNYYNIDPRDLELTELGVEIVRQFEEVNNV